MMRVSPFRKCTGQGFISLLYNNIYIMQKYARHCFPTHIHRERERGVNERQDLQARVFWVWITGNPINSLKSQERKKKHLSRTGIHDSQNGSFYSDKAFCIHFWLIWVTLHWRRVWGKKKTFIMRFVFIIYWSTHFKMSKGTPSLVIRVETFLGSFQIKMLQRMRSPRGT